MCTTFDTTIRTFCYFLILAVFSFFLFGCANTFDIPSVQPDASDSKDVSDQSGISFDEGGTKPIIHMPFASGHVSQCTQGVNGYASHRSSSTMYDLDFDTSNTLKEQLRAPVSGIVRVHMEDASKNFGFHICIDLGNGTYVIIAHMFQISVKDGDKVVAGQFIGYEGCTGYCSGDHVHIGLHMGDARKMGQFGVSIPVSYMLSDKTAKTGPRAIESTSLVCGIKTLGDKVNGHMYVSALPGVHESTNNTASTTSTSSTSQGSSSSSGSSSQSQSTSQANEQKNADDVWIENKEIDTVKHVLHMNASRWINTNLSMQDAYVWGTGGCFDQKLSEADRVKPQNGYYLIDFAKFSQDCSGDITLISTVGTDGKPPNASMTNWSWWQNAEFCSKGSVFCELKKNGQPWEEWMIRVSWSPYSGLVANGNGYTKNSQLK